MRVETIRALPEFAPMRPQVAADSRVAVLLNANARRVNDKVERALRHVVPASDLYISHSEEEARSIARWVVDQRYRTVFCGGGDGTFVTWMNLIMDLIDGPAGGPLRRPGLLSMASPRNPRFGILRLGTGNALAEYVGASPLKGDGIVDDVLRARAGEIPSTKLLDLLLIDGKRAQFAGLGIDGAVLNDFVSMKSALARGPLRGLASGGVGYFLAIAGKSVPEQLLKKPAVARVVSHGSALKLGKDGRPEGAATGPGAILYEGPLRIASAATIPYYGYRFKLFPYAGKRRSMMQLRLSDMSVPSILVSLPKIWDGKFSHPNLYDFLAEDVTLEFDREMPLQVAGDAAGYHKSVRIGMAPRSVELIDFSSRRS